jgi:2-haloacid dehalogenase
MNRRDFVSSSLAGAAVLMTADTASAAGPAPSAGSPLRPKVLFFDVNETLLDLNAMRASVAPRIVHSSIHEW